MLNLPRSAWARAQGPCRLTGYTVRAFRRRFPTASPTGSFEQPVP